MQNQQKNSYFSPMHTPRKRYHSLSELSKLGDYAFHPKNKIGEGLSSVVYKGINVLNREAVAIKVVEKCKIRQKLLELFRNQIKILTKLKHLNIIKLCGVVENEKQLWIVTEYCMKGDLNKIIYQNGRLSQQRAMNFFTKIINGYSYLSQFSIVHRDLKPSNIFLNQNTVKIADFGFSALANDIQSLKINVGSPLYMAPECLNNHFATQKSDIFSLGIILYEMLHGKTPWNAKIQHQLLQKIKTIPLHIDEELQLSQDCKNILKKCLQIDSQKRISESQLVELIKIYEQKRLQQLKQRYFQSKAISTEMSGGAEIKQNITLKRQISVKTKQVQLQKRFSETNDNKITLKRNRKLSSIVKQNQKQTVTPISFIQNLEVDKILGIQNKGNKQNKYKIKVQDGQDIWNELKKNINDLREALNTDKKKNLSQQSIFKINYYLAFYDKLIDNQKGMNQKGQFIKSKTIQYYSKIISEFFDKIIDLIQKKLKEELNTNNFYIKLLLLNSALKEIKKQKSPNQQLSNNIH